MATHGKTKYVYIFIYLFIFSFLFFPTSGDGNLPKSLHFGFSFFFFAEILPVEKKGWVERLNECTRGNE
jgi:hypothetical protein